MSPNDLTRSRKRSGRRNAVRKRQRDPRGRFLPIQRTTNAESTGRVGKEEKGQACNGQTNGSTTVTEIISMAMKSSFCMEEGLKALQRIDNCIKENLPAGLDYDSRNQEAFRLLKNLTQDVLERRPDPQSHSGLIFSSLCDLLQISEDTLLHLLTSLG